MAEILRLFQLEAAFDPESIEVLTAALDDAWNTIEKSGSRFARPAYSRAMREVIAKRIIEMARRGITDQQKLADDAVSGNARLNSSIGLPAISLRRAASRGCSSVAKAVRRA